MTDMDEEDMEFIEKVMKHNKNGLKRLAREEDAAEKRRSSMKKQLKSIYRNLREIAGRKDDEPGFTKIES